MSQNFSRLIAFLRKTCLAAKMDSDKKSVSVPLKGTLKCTGVRKLSTVENYL